MAMKTSLKKWIYLASNFIALIPSCLIHQMLANFLESNSKGLYESSRQQKQSSYLVFPSSTKREIMHFHIVVAQSCCFAIFEPVAFLPLLLPSSSSLLKLPIIIKGALSRLSSSFCQQCQLRILPRNGTWEINCKWQNHSFKSNKYAS